MRVEPRHTPDELAELARREPRAGVARRLLCVRAAMLGRTAAESGAESLMSERSARGWVARYNAGGVESLADRPGRGRRPPLSPEQGAALAERIAAGPTGADAVCALRGEDVRRILATEFGVVRKLAAVYVILRKMGLAPLRPRPAPPRADPEARESFKKVCPDSSPGSPPPGPMERSRSGSRTRPGSAKKGR